MMLQDLVSHAIEQRWFSPSYKGPLQSYAKKYAAALGYDASKCPAHIYHLPDAQMRQKIIDAAPDDLNPRSIQVCITALLKLFYRAVTEGDLPSLQQQLVSWKRRGTAKGKRLPRHRFVGKDGKDLNLKRYGLREWPEDLLNDINKYLTWCQNDLDLKRPHHIKKNDDTCARVRKSVGQVAGYAVSVEELPAELLTLQDLCDPALLERFTQWWVKRRERWTDTVFNIIGDLKTIARWHLKDEPTAQAIAELMRRCDRVAPDRTRKVVKKHERLLSLEELDRLAQSLNPLNERHKQENYEARCVARWLADPERNPLAPSTFIGGRTGRRAMNLKVWATWVEKELIIRLLIHRPLRISNICEMTFRNLQPRPDGGYDIVFSHEELKNGKYLYEEEWRERFPARLKLLLKDWLEVWRPRLLHNEHPRKAVYGHKIDPTEDHSDYIFLNSEGRRYDKAVLGQSIGNATWRYTQDRIGGPVVWSPHFIRTTWTSEMLNAGLNPQIIRRIMGDSLKILVKHYTEVHREEASPFAKQLAKEIEQRID